MPSLESKGVCENFDGSQLVIPYGRRGYMQLAACSARGRLETRSGAPGTLRLEDTLVACYWCRFKPIGCFRACWISGGWISLVVADSWPWHRFQPLHLVLTPSRVLLQHALVCLDFGPVRYEVPLDGLVALCWTVSNTIVSTGRTSSY